MSTKHIQSDSKISFEVNGDDEEDTEIETEAGKDRKIISIKDILSNIKR